MKIVVGKAIGVKAPATAAASVKTSPQALIELIKQRTVAVKGAYLTLHLKDGSSLPTDAIEHQSDAAKAAKAAGIAFYWE